MFPAPAVGQHSITTVMLAKTYRRRLVESRIRRSSRAATKISYVTDTLSLPSARFSRKAVAAWLVLESRP